METEFKKIYDFKEKNIQFKIVSKQLKNILIPMKNSNNYCYFNTLM